MFDEDFALGVDDGDCVTVDDGEDFLEAVLSADPVLDAGQHERAVAGQPPGGGAAEARPIAAILSCTLIGPWSKPEASRAARTCSA